MFESCTTGGEKGDRYSPLTVPGYKGGLSSGLFPQLSCIYNVFFEGREKVSYRWCHFMFRLEFGWFQSLAYVGVWKWANATKFSFWSPFGSFLGFTVPISFIVLNSMTTTPLCHSILCFLSPLGQYTKLPHCSCSKVCRQLVPGEPQPMHALLPAELCFSVFSLHSWLIVCYLLHQQGKGLDFYSQGKEQGVR